MNRTVESRQGMRVPSILLAAALAMFAILVMRIIAVESPVMASDEYAYFMTAKYDDMRADVYRYDPAMQAVDNQVYPLLFDAWETVSVERTALVGRVFNALLYVASSLLLFLLFHRAFGQRVATISAVLYLLFPFSFYATTLLPEVEFQFCVYFTVFLVMGTIAIRNPLVVLLPALASAIAYFVKPHAAALIVAVATFYVAASVLPVGVEPEGLARRLAKGMARALLYVLAVFAFIYLGRKFSMEGQSGGSGLVASFYGSYLSRLSSPTYLLQNVWSMLDYVAGHTWALAVMFAPGMLAMGALWKRAWMGLRAGHRHSSIDADDRERMQLALLVGLLGIAFLVMIAAFTNSASQVSAFEKYRLHGRYLEPLLPLLLGFSVWAVAQSRRSMAIGLASFASVALFAFYLRFQYHLYPWDYPDVFVFFTSRMKHWSMGGTNDWLIWLVVASSAVFAVCCALRRRPLAAYVAYLVILMLGSHIQMSNWLRLHSETNRAAIEAGDALRDYLGSPRPGSGLVLVSDRYGRSSYFLMEFSSLQHVVSVAPNASFNGPVPAGVEWIIAPSGVQVDAGDTQAIEFGEQVLYRLGTDATYVGPGQHAPPTSTRPSPAAEADGGRVYDFADAGLDGQLSHFHAREPWGRWSSGRVSGLTLTTPVEGRVALTLRGWVAATHADGRVVVRMGGREQTVTMTTQPADYPLTFELGGPAQNIEFSTAPVQVEGDGRTLGVAIARVRLKPGE